MYHIINLSTGKLLPTMYTNKEWAISSAQKFMRESNHEYIVASNVHKVDAFSKSSEIPIINLANCEQPLINIADMANWG